MLDKFSCDSIRSHSSRLHPHLHQGQVFTQVSQTKHICLANTHVAAVTPKATALTAKFMLPALVHLKLGFE